MGLKFNPADAGTTTTAPAGGGGGEKDGFDPVPVDTLLDVEIVRCEERVVNKAVTPWKKWDDEVVFAFRVIDGEYKNRWFWVDVPAVLDNSPKCKLRLYLQSILGVDSLAEAFPGGLDFDANDYLGQECQIRIGTYFSKKKQTIENSVEDVLPAVRSGAEAPTVQEAF